MQNAAEVTGAQKGEQLFIPSPKALTTCHKLKNETTLREGTCVQVLGNLDLLATIFGFLPCREPPFGGLATAGLRKHRLMSVCKAWNMALQRPEAWRTPFEFHVGRRQGELGWCGLPLGHASAVPWLRRVITDPAAVTVTATTTVQDKWAGVVPLAVLPVRELRLHATRVAFLNSRVMHAFCFTGSPLRKLALTGGLEYTGRAC